MLIEGNKSMILSKLTPKKCIWNKTNVTLLAADCVGPFKAHGKTQITVAESNMQMTNKLHRLRYELKSKEIKLKTLNDRCKEDKLKFKKKLRVKSRQQCFLVKRLNSQKIEEMRLNEEQMIDDLYSQQGLTKDAIRSMESLSDQLALSYCWLASIARLSTSFSCVPVHLKLSLAQLSPCLLI